MHALTQPNDQASNGPKGKKLALLSLAALGVVYGDIGTSPLYALRECFYGQYAIEITFENVFGILSLMAWSLMIIVTVKYLSYILLADNHGEGGALFGPIMIVWSVVTGAETLYADLGRFGRRSIRTAWIFVVFPALLCNYFGQGALLLMEPARAHNPFYALAPQWMLWPLVVLATAATIIASQAVISGAVIFMFLTSWNRGWTSKWMRLPSFWEGRTSNPRRFHCCRLGDVK